MKNLRKYLITFINIFLLTILFVNFSYGENNSNEISIKEFNKIDVKEQSKYINSLDKKVKFSFLAKLLTERIFRTNNNYVLKFLKDGKLLFTKINRKKSCKTINWSIVNNTLYIKKTNRNYEFPQKKSLECNKFFAKIVNIIQNNKTWRQLVLVFYFENPDDILLIINFEKNSAIYQKYFNNCE